MNIVGVCRFSLVGRGDWKAFQKKSLDEANAIATAQAEVLFQPERMEARLRSFELLTLASVRAQTDQDFRFIVLASELMPGQYRSRLEAMCATIPQVTLRFFPVTTAGQAQKVVFQELGLTYNDCMQFRLDDDDCLCVEYVEVLRKNTVDNFKEDGIFVASVKNVLYSCSGGPHAGAYYWPVEFMSAGAAIRHPVMSIYHFGHFVLPKRFPSVIIDEHLSLVTHNGTNDTSFDQATIKRRGMTLLEPSKVRELVGRHFSFLTNEAKNITGIPDRKQATNATTPSTAAPKWYLDQLETKNKKGFFISDDKFALQHTERSKNVLYVSFDNLSSVRDEKNRDPWGYSFAAKSDWSHLGVLCYRPNWFRTPKLIAELERLSSDGFFRKFKKVVFTGTSMGAYAACAFSSLAPGSIVIAFSPQSTLDPNIAGWDKRYPFGSKSNWTGNFSDAAHEISSAKQAWIVYDPKVEEDRRHAERLEGPNTFLLKARYSSHFTAQYMGQIGIMGKFSRACVEGVMTEQRFYSLYREGRQYRRYLTGLVESVLSTASEERRNKIESILRNMNKPGLANELAKASRTASSEL